MEECEQCGEYFDPDEISRCGGGCGMKLCEECRNKHVRKGCPS